MNDSRNTEEYRSRIRAAARDQIPDILRRAGGTLPLDKIYQDFQARNHELSDGSVKCCGGNDTVWRHYVRWALQNLKDKRVVESARRGEWTLSDSRVGPKTPSQFGVADLNLRHRKTKRPAELKPGLSISELIEEQNQGLRETLIQELMELEPKEFERFGEKLARSLSFTEVEVTQYTNDDGVDVFGTLEMGVVKVRGAFQMKRWKNTVGRDPVVKFRGSIQGKYDHGIFVTTSSFSESAKELASQPGAVPVVMVDGARLATIMIDHGIGVQTQPVVLRTIDRSFFEDLRHV